MILKKTILILNFKIIFQLKILKMMIQILYRIIIVRIFQAKIIQVYWVKIIPSIKDKKIIKKKMNLKKWIL